MNFFKAFFIITIIALLQACNQATPTSNPTTPAATGGNVNVVYVNVDTLLEGYDLYKEKKKELEERSEREEKALGAKIEAFQKRGQKFEQELYEIQQKAATIAPVELKALEQKYAAQQASLAKEEQTLMKQRDDAARAIDKELTDIQGKLTKNVDDYLSKIAKEKNYDFILRKGVVGGVMFGKESLDITKDAIKGLNEAYKTAPK